MTPAELCSAIVAASERLYVDWVPLADTGMLVSAQPVRIDGADGPIFPATPVIAQTAADMLEAFCTCAEIDDLIWTHATVRLDPHTYPNDGSWEQAMQWWRWAENELAQRRHGPGTLCALGDKSWVVRDTEVHGKIPNYGMHVPRAECSPQGTWRGVMTYPTVTRTAARVVQPVAYAHNQAHWDYSQHVRLWKWADKPVDHPWLPKARRLAWL